MSTYNLEVIKNALSNRSTLKNYEIRYIEEELTICKELLSNLVDLYPKEINLITNTFRLNLIYVHFISQFSESVLKKSNLKPAEFYEEITNCIENWLEKECAGSILYSFGVEERSALSATLLHEITNNSNKKDNNQSRNEYQPSSKRFRKHISEHDIKSMDFEEDFFDSTPHEKRVSSSKKLSKHFISMMKEHNRFHDYIGTNQEAYIYNCLLKIKLDHYTMPNKPTNSKKENNFVLNDQEYSKKILSFLSLRLSCCNFEDLLKVMLKLIGENRYIADLLNKINDIIFDKVTNDHGSCFKLLLKYESKNNIYIRSVCEKFLSHKWRSDQDVNKFDLNFNKIEFILKWEPFMLLLERDYESILRKKSASNFLLNQQWQNVFLSALNHFINQLNKIKSGDIEFRMVRLFYDNLSSFLILCECLINKCYPNDKQNLLEPLNLSKFSQNLRQIIVYRYNEFNQFEHYRLMITGIVQIFSKFEIIDTYLLEQELNDLSRLNHKQIKLKDICDVAKLDEIIKWQPNPIITYFKKITIKEMQIIEKVNNLDRLYCILFDDILSKNIKSYQNTSKDQLIPFITIINELLPQTFSKWQEISKSIDDGSLKLCKIDDYVSNYFRHDYQKFQNEIFYLIDYYKIPNLAERKKQIVLYNQFKSSREAACEIENLRIRLEMTAQFDEIADLINIKPEIFREWNLTKMDTNLERVINILIKVNREKVACIKAFVDSLDLIKWLRENTPTLDKLKFFVDLTTMSNTNDQSDRNDLLAKMLLEAGTAYAPLIYDLKATDSFNQLMNLFDRVWSFLKTQKNIAEKLLAVNDQKNKLELIKQESSNKEVGYINKAKQFNEKGVYKIGNHNSLAYYDLSQYNQSQVCIENIIELECDIEIIGDQRRKTESKNVKLNYEKLNELKNFLMLVARKSSISINNNDDDSETVDYFIEVFDYVIRLANAYLKLINKGCFLFEYFLAKLKCRYPASNKSHLEISLSQKVKIDNTIDSTIECLKSSCEFLENCYDLWLEEINSIRNEYDSINYFSINQIIYLRKILSKYLLIKSGKQNSSSHDSFSFNQLFDMFYLLTHSSDIYSNNNLDFYLTLFNKSKQEFQKTSKFHDQKSISVQEKRNEIFIHDFASRNNFSLALVQKAVEEFGTQNEDKLYDFCLENDGLSDIDVPSKKMSDISIHEDTNDIEMNDLEDEALIGFNDQNEINLMKSLAKCKSFKEKIDLIWLTFMTNQNKFNREDLFLSLQHLALFLDQIKLKYSTHTNSIVRNSPGYLNKGRPNLIMCPSRDQIRLVLSIYANSTHQPLPLLDEVLYCNSDTSNEEVENFLRVALKSEGTKIYTLVNINQLDYLTSKKIEEFLNKNIDFSRSNNYLLVFICSSLDQSNKDQHLGHQQSQSSLLISSLIKFKVEAIMLSEEEIQDYVMTKMSNNPNFLCQYDRDKSSVRALLSQKPGNGKSSYVKNLVNSIKNVKFEYKCIRIKTNKLILDDEIKKLFDSKKIQNTPTIYHIDIAFEVFSNVDKFLFNLTILGYLRHSNGLLWKRNDQDIYFIEMMPPYLEVFHNKLPKLISYHYILNYLPRIDFRTPKKYYYDLYNLKKIELEQRSRLKLYDDSLFMNYFHLKKYQRVCTYLKLFKEDPEKVDDLNVNRNKGMSTQLISELECLKILLEAEYSQLKNPNWSELNNFVNFLDEQLDVLENALIISEIKELKSICARLLVMMAYDFGLPTLNLSENSNVFQVKSDNQIELLMDQLEIIRSWENSSHPYMIPNLPDRESFTFMGIYLNRRNYEFMNPNTNQVFDMLNLKITSTLRIELLKQKVPIYDNFDEFPRTKKIAALRNVLGQNNRDQLNHDPDPSYELTIDNCLKLMAIFMRLKSGSPVVIMGETGCGKTRKIKFFSDLHLIPSMGDKMKHLIHFKIHGGTTAEDIEKVLIKAERLAQQNKRKLNEINKQFSVSNNSKATSISLQNSSYVNSYQPATAILFFDEANTTEAIGLIKEIMCDLTCNGRLIDFQSGLKLIAAVNPYRKHSPKMIEKLEEAGLGFFISANDSKDKLGHIPMRQLVYRVQPLPSSLLPLVFDFGQLDSNAEKVYIKQMLIKATKNKKLPSIDENNLEKLCDLLTYSQKFIREQRDECSFVSLRDIERVILVTNWFFTKKDLIFTRMNNKKLIQFTNDSYQTQLSDINRSFILALIVCYYSSLYNKTTRFNYRNLLSSKFGLASSIDWVQYEILKCQHIFLDEVELNNNIARNSALLENVFMIIVCLELRIPLFIVGKPGSSKSLAKTIVSGAMTGKNSKKELFQNLKQTFFVNFQCSPLTKPEMIIDAFKTAASFQENNDLNQSVAVVNLDEIGLAEASDSMPLKTLHPLMEEGTDSSDQVAQPHQKVGVIGISNWALDPAKMNRALYVSRGDPDIDELIESAKGICKYEQHIYDCIKPYIRDIAVSYLKLCETAKQKTREFFGLRDYYSLIKMIYWFCLKDAKLTWAKLEHSVRRNFGGLEINVIKPFYDSLHAKLDINKIDTDPSCQPVDLVYAAIKGANVESDSRYLLLITENYSVVDMLQNYLTNSLNIPQNKLDIIFGSSFPADLAYTEICRNISRIKHSMEIGNRVILLNFYNLYESLYDALNQYYYEFHGQKHVYLGLGTQRVICTVHDDFRLIIISDKESVYNPKRFPIPLLNRLEKHFLNASSLLDENLKVINENLRIWLKHFTDSSKTKNGYVPKLNELFIGYHDETLPQLLLYFKQKSYSLLQNEKQEMKDYNYEDEELIKYVKNMLLRCVTPDCIVRLCSTRNVEINRDEIWSEYFNNHYFNSFEDLLAKHIRENENKKSSSLYMNKNLIQISTHSKHCSNKIDLTKFTDSSNINFKSFHLKEFATQQQFSMKLKQFLDNSANNSSKLSNNMDLDSEMDNEIKILMIRCDFSNSFNSDLLSCARYSIEKQLKEMTNLENVYIILIVNLSRENSKHFIGFQVSNWSCYHIDELDESFNYLPTIDKLKDISLGSLLENALQIFNTTEAINEKEHMNLKIFLERIAYQSCSLIVDTNIKRTIDRIALLIKLAENNDFFIAFFERLIDLQKQKEVNFAPPWLSKEAADLGTISEYSTLRKSCQHYIESKLSPLIAFILSKIDLYSNLDIYLDSLETKTEWKSDLWLNIFKNTSFFKLNYAEMKVNNVELKEFQCKSDWNKLKFGQDIDKNFLFKPCIPFFWILVDQLNQFWLNFNQRGFSKIKSDSLIGYKYQNFIKTIPNLFESTIIYEVLNSTFSSDKVDKNIDFLDLYIVDFVLCNTQVSNREELYIIKKILTERIDVLNLDKSNLKLTLSVVNFVYDQLNDDISDYLKYSKINSDLNQKLSEKMEKEKIKLLGLESSLACINVFERKFIKHDSFDYEKIQNEVSNILYLIKNTLDIGNKNITFKLFRDADVSIQSKYAELNCKYNSMKFYDLFNQYVLRYPYKLLTNNKPLFNESLIELSNILKKRYLKEITSKNNLFNIEKINEFIIKCVSKVRTEFYHENQTSKCCSMIKKSFCKLLTNCSCYVCSDCELKMRSNINVRTKRVVCLSCRQEIDINFGDINRLSIKLTDVIQFNEAIDELTEALNQLYLKTLENLIFKSDLDNDIVIKLMKSLSEYSITSSSDMYTYLSLKPNYVSLIFQSLFIKNESLVCGYLKEFINSVPSNQNLAKYLYPISLNLQNSLQQKYNLQLLKRNIDYQVGIVERITLELNKQNMIENIFTATKRDNKLNVDYILYIAKLKLCLKILAKVTNSKIAFDCLEDKELFQEFNKRMKSILETSFNNAHTDTVFNYLIKELIRKYSSSSIKYVITNPDIKWMIPTVLIGDNLAVNDTFVLIGERYLKLKEAISDCFKEKKSEPFVKYLEQSSKNQQEIFPILCMAIYRNITVKHKDVPNLPLDLFLPTLTKIYNQSSEHWRPLLENNLSGHMKINTDNWPYLNINQLIIQAKFSILYSKSKLVESLAQLIRYPAEYRNSYFPTMPQDDMFDIHRAVRAAVSTNENPTFYTCPNGHPYVLFDCGRPMNQYKCKVCNESIGGTNHNLLQTNRRMDINDNTFKGYCLSEASIVSKEPHAERLLTSAAAQTIRFLLHTCLYFACDSNQQNVHALMTTPQQNVNLKRFFWDHINLDIAILGKALNMNADESILLLHNICNDLLKSNKSTFASKWMTKDERQNWEKTFYDEFLLNNLKDPAKIVTTSTRILREESNKESDKPNDKLYFMAYELSTDITKENYLYQNSEYWKYSPIVDFQIMKNELNSNTEKDEYLLLKKFIQMVNFFFKKLKTIYLRIYIFFLNLFLGYKFKVNC
jgi:hypothetical protein